MVRGLRLQDVVCSFAKCAARTLEFAVMNMQAQPNCNDCGLFAVATATALAFNVDPLLCHFDGPRMRTHLKTLRKIADFLPMKLDGDIHFLSGF